MTHNEKKLIEFLSLYKVQYKRTTENAINICCPFCIGKTTKRKDDRFLCGIFLPKYNYHCFRCHRTGNIIELLKSVTGLDYNTIQTFFKSHFTNEDSLVNVVKKKLKRDENSKTTKTKSKLKMIGIPIDETIKGLFPLLDRFLKNRDISYSTCYQNAATYVPCSGKYSNRLVIPIYYNNQLVNFQARDVTNKHKEKYLNPSGRNINNYLYWMDEIVNENIYIVEGLFDAWRMKTNAVCIFGKNLSRAQKSQLLKEENKKFVFCLDSDALALNIKQAKELAPFVETGYVMLPKGKDPDELGEEYIKNLKVKWL